MRAFQGSSRIDECRDNLRGRWLILLCLGAFVCGATVYYFKDHLYWRYCSRKVEGWDRPSIHVVTSSGDTCDAAGDWSVHDLGGVTVRIPPEFTLQDRVALELPGRWTLWAGANKRIIAMKNTDPGLLDQQLPSDWMPGEEFSERVTAMTVPELRRECYIASVDDFSWLDSPRQVRWHTYLMKQGQRLDLIERDHTLAGPQNDTYAEFRKTDDVVWLLHGATDEAVIEWQRVDGSAWGFLDMTHEGGVHDKEWIQCVARSLEPAPPDEGKD